MMIDEAHSHLYVYVNEKNCRCWAAENPRELHQHPLHSESHRLVYCELPWSNQTLFFQDAQRATVTLTSSERYVFMLEIFLIQKLRRRRINKKNVWFQQDCATALTARASMEVVRRIFPERVISRFGDVPYPFVPLIFQLPITFYGNT